MHNLVKETVMVTKTYWVAPDGHKTEVNNDRDLEDAKCYYVQRVCARLGINGLYTKKEKYPSYHELVNLKEVDMDTILKIADMIHCDKLAANSKG